MYQIIVILKLTFHDRYRRLWYVGEAISNVHSPNTLTTDPNTSKSIKLIPNVNLIQQSVNQSKMILWIRMKNKRVITSNWYRALARKLKVLTFSQNWEIRLVFTKGRHHGWRKKKTLKTHVDHSVHWGYQPTLKNTTSRFSCQTPPP